jgi:transcriptional regulator with XRE-family HTH domain
MLQFPKGRPDLFSGSSKMKHKALQNYLKAFRKKSGLSQYEIGKIIGFHDGGQVSRHERSQSVPTLENALAYAAILQVPITQIFAGLSSATAHAIEKKIDQLETDLRSSDKEKCRPITAQKLAWISKRKSL